MCESVFFLCVVFSSGGTQLGVWVPGPGARNARLQRGSQSGETTGADPVLHRRVGGGDDADSLRSELSNQWR